MYLDVPWPFLAIVALALSFAYLNGTLDGGSLLAAAISSRSVSPLPALALASVAAFVGPFIFGTAVAGTIATEIVKPDVVGPSLVIAALIGAVAWNTTASLVGIPTSSTHALIGGLIGAGLTGYGPDVIVNTGLSLIIVALVAGPVLGLFLGYLGLRAVVFLVKGASPAINKQFRRALVVILVILALSHGTNDGQKTMGVIVLGLLTFGLLTGPQVPLWVVAASAGALALGVATGGLRVVRTLGRGLYRVRPLHGFSSQTVAAAIILSATLLGAPVSTGQVVSSSILGVGAAYRISAVRWAVARNIFIAWLVTMPVSGLVAGVAFLLLPTL
ncbi:MAG: inorganic phosphate transporter [Chloroflexota bacterium]